MGWSKGLVWLIDEAVVCLQMHRWTSHLLAPALSGRPRDALRYH